jgi:hypothetical protein
MRETAVTRKDFDGPRGNHPIEVRHDRAEVSGERRSAATAQTRASGKHARSTVVDTKAILTSSMFMISLHCWCPHVSPKATEWRSMTRKLAFTAWGFYSNAGLKIPRVGGSIPPLGTNNSLRFLDGRSGCGSFEYRRPCFAVHSFKGRLRAVALGRSRLLESPAEATRGCLISATRRG